RDVLPKTLTQAGAKVTECVVYRNDDVQEPAPEIVRRLRDGSLDWVGLSSPSIARRFAQVLCDHRIDPAVSGTRLVAISPVTAAAARDSGLVVAAEASVYTWDGMIDAIAAQPPV
ncbi:MAG: uroporphyrinogen-III synthase, partial [Fuerstiella sp.]